MLVMIDLLLNILWIYFIYKYKWEVIKQMGRLSYYLTYNPLINVTCVIKSSLFWWLNDLCISHALWLIPSCFVAASTSKMAGQLAARGARAPHWREARPPPPWCCRRCRNAASPSSTDLTPTSRCRRSRCPGIAPSPAKGKCAVRFM